MNNLKINIYELNFILTFAGFPFITSVSDSIPSVLYRAIALGIALICIWKTGFKIKLKNRFLKGYIFILLLMILKATWSITLGEYSSSSYDGVRTLILSFAYGIVLIPIWAFITSWDRINWTKCFVILQLILIFVIIKGLFYYTGDLAAAGRSNLNERQSTLAFGDNSAYLLLLSICLMLKNQWSKVVIFKIIKIVCFIGIIIGLFGLMKSGSRGPLFSCLAGLLFLFLKQKRKYQTRIILGIFIGLIFAGGIIASYLNDIAPILYERVMLTVETGDLSGRENLYMKAFDIINNNIIFGTIPILIYHDGFSSYHNCYLDVFVGLGVFGFLYFIYLNFIIVKKLICLSNADLPILFMGAMFFCNAARAMSGVNMLSNALYSLIICFSLLYSFNYINTNDSIISEN